MSKRISRNSQKDVTQNDFPRTVFTMHVGSVTERSVLALLLNTKRISNGAFGIVYKADLHVYDNIKSGGEVSDVPEFNERKSLSSLCTPKDSTEEFIKISKKYESIAVKKVLQDERFKNRELQILKILNHENVIKLNYFFKMQEQAGTFLCLIFDYFPYNLSQYYREQHQKFGEMDKNAVKTMMLHLAKGLKYIHAMDICHRDIKPQNLLYDPCKNILKLTDFGSAKQLTRSQKNVSYICSRHYRAPELIIGQTIYTVSIDIWSMGCVMGELIIGKPLFQGESNVAQLTEIVKILGFPSLEDFKDMNPEYKVGKIISVTPITLKQIISDKKWEDAVLLLNEILMYSPYKRISGEKICEHAYFQNLQKNTCKQVV